MGEEGTAVTHRTSNNLQTVPTRTAAEHAGCWLKQMQHARPHSLAERSAFSVPLNMIHTQHIAKIKRTDQH